LQILASTPLCVTTLLWEGAPGEWTLTVAVKVTLSIEHEREAFLSDVQVDATGDRTHGEVPGASLRETNDVAPFKPRVDVMLVGHAYAPGGVPVSELVATLRVGELEKSLRVFGDRDPRAPPGAAPVPFSLMPIRYERGARSAAIPLGVDGARAMPNLVPLVAGHAPSFGPLSPEWPCRRELLDAAGQRWARALHPRTPRAPSAPPGIEHAFFNAAPFEQRLALLRPGTTVELVNLHPTHERFVTQIPALRPRVYQKDPAQPRPRELPLRCDTLWIDADDGLATLTFRGLVGVATGDERDLPALLVVLQSPERPPPLVQVEALLRAQGDAAEGLVATHPLAVRHDAVKSSEPLGEVPAQAPPSSPLRASEPANVPLAEPVDVPEPSPRGPSREPWRDGALAAHGGRTMELSVPAHLAEALPFAASAPPPEEPTTDALPEETTQGLAPGRTSEGAAPPIDASGLPIDVAAYAALVVLVERGEAARATSALGIAAGDLQALLDVCAVRIDGDGNLARQVARFVEDARAAEPLP